MESFPPPHNFSLTIPFIAANQLSTAPSHLSACTYKSCASIPLQSSATNPQGARTKPPAARQRHLLGSPPAKSDKIRAGAMLAKSCGSNPCRSKPFWLGRGVQNAFSLLKWTKQNMELSFRSLFSGWLTLKGDPTHPHPPPPTPPHPTPPHPTPPHPTPPHPAIKKKKTQRLPSGPLVGRKLSHGHALGAARARRAQLRALPGGRSSAPRHGNFRLRLRRCTDSARKWLFAHGFGDSTFGVNNLSGSMRKEKREGKGSCLTKFDQAWPQTHR